MDSLDDIYKALGQEAEGHEALRHRGRLHHRHDPFRTVKVTPSVQNKYLKQIYNLLLVKSLRMAAVVWFNLEDNVNWPGGLLEVERQQEAELQLVRELRAAPDPRQPEVGGQPTLDRDALLERKRSSWSTCRFTSTRRSRSDP